MQQVTISHRGLPPRPFNPRRRNWHELTPEEKHRETIRLVCAPTRSRKVPVSLPKLAFMTKEMI